VTFPCTLVSRLSNVDASRLAPSRVDATLPSAPSSVGTAAVTAVRVVSELVPSIPASLPITSALNWPCTSSTRFIILLLYTPNKVLEYLDAK
jgi:hypothetical protein